MNQARALGEAFANTRLTAIYASPLKRAFMTATALLDAQPDPKPPIHNSDLLKEQNFGKAEGTSWLGKQDPNKTLEEHFASGQYPVLFDPVLKFPDGESLNDLAERADQAIRELVLPHVLQAARPESEDDHIALVSHGLCISQMVAALVRRNHGGAPHRDYRGLLNTAWTRVTVQVKGEVSWETMDISEDDSSPILVNVTDFNRHEHTNSVKRQKGGIGSSAYDPKQQDIRDFFGGKAVEAVEDNKSDASDQKD
ncbi:histidine phosphatase superfamily [Scleroderma yunnanense]